MKLKKIPRAADKNKLKASDFIWIGVGTLIFLVSLGVVLGVILQ